jgi:Zn-dependent protease with chaperone function
MSTLQAVYYDGKTSGKRAVQIELAAPGQVIIRGLENELRYRLTEVRIAPRVGNTPRSIYLPGEAKCETSDNDTIDVFLKRHRHGTGSAWLHTLESHLGYVVLALVITAVSVWGLIEYGVPLLAKHVARALPASVDAALGEQGLSMLDRTFFAPSRLSAQRQQALRALFADNTADLIDGEQMQLVFRSSPRIGANAFALPSGTIVITDELVTLARHDDELVAVLAHEIGHVVHRHALRRVLQDSTVVLIIAAVTGDVASITSLAATIPTVLVEAKYSRNFEREADEYALQHLRAHNIAPHYFADILLRMENTRPSRGDIPDYLATHPATEERILLFKEAS